MPAQGDEATLVRFATGDDSSSLTSDVIDMLFDKAESDYAGYSRKVFTQAVIVMRLKNLVAQARKETNYKLNERSENLSDIAKGLFQDYEDAKAELEQLISEEKPVALRLGVPKKVPSRTRSFPNG